MSKAYVVSTFDMVNVADLDLLRQVDQRCEEMVIAVLSDELVTSLHGRPAVVPEAERLELVRNLRISDKVLLCTKLDDLPSDGELLTDKESLAYRASAVLTPARRSASPELLAALAAPGVTR